MSPSRVPVFNAGRIRSTCRLSRSPWIRWTFSVAVGVALSGAGPALAGAPGVRFEGGIGYVFGSGFHDLLKKAYGADNEVSGGSGLLDVQGGVGLQLGQFLSIGARLDWLFGSVKVETPFGVPSESGLSLIGPSCSMQCAYRGIYVSADIGVASPSSGLSRIDLRSTGPTAGVALGACGGGAEFELGYLRVPLEASAEGGPFERSDFGGVRLLIRWVGVLDPNHGRNRGQSTRSETR